uniref:Uncharacterized protein n=1 Tax=Seriola dumerili TaxID=41447 RepID=A0A3B4TZL1_SERDU
MPGSNTGHLPQTLVSLSGELLCVPATSMTPGDANDINHLILVEDSRYRHSLLQTLLCPLHLHYVGFFLVLHQCEEMLAYLGLFLSCLILPLLVVLGEVFVESALALITQMLGKDGFKGTRSFNDGNCLHLLSAVHLPEGVGHASLVSQEGGEVDRLARVVFGPRTHLKPQVPVAGCMEFAMRLERT